MMTMKPKKNWMMSTKLELVVEVEVETLMQLILKTKIIS